MDIVAFTGAGISQESGIPTFEALGEDFRRLLSRPVFNSDPTCVYNCLLKLKKACDEAQPNAAHMALARREIPVITMNIDGLHRRAGSCDVIEIHGSIEHVRCDRCSVEFAFEQAALSCYCPQCNAVLQHDVVLYGDPIPLLAEALHRVEGKGVLVVVGTSFYTSTSSYVVDHAKKCGREIILVNECAETALPGILDEL